MTRTPAGHGRPEPTKGLRTIMFAVDAIDDLDAAVTGRERPREE